MIPLGSIFDFPAFRSLTKSAKIVYLFVYFEQRRGVTRLSSEAIAAGADVNPSTVFEAIAELEGLGAISIERRPGTPNSYKAIGVGDWCKASKSRSA